MVINASPDGYNINKNAGSTHPEQLQAMGVMAHAADARAGGAVPVLAEHVFDLVFLAVGQLEAAARELRERCDLGRGARGVAPRGRGRGGDQRVAGRLQHQQERRIHPPRGRARRT